jgi:hypothetical protein
MGQSISATLINPVNAPVPARVKDWSVDSDIADPFLAAVQPAVAEPEAGAARLVTNFPSLRWAGGALDFRS